MTKLSQLSTQDREYLEQDLDLALELTELRHREEVRPVSVADLYRYAQNPDFNRDGDIRRAIVKDTRISSHWASILARRNGSQYDLAAAAAGPSERILLQDRRGGRRVELTRSSSEPDSAILIVDLGETSTAKPRRLSVWTETKAFELDLPAPHLGVCQIDLKYDGEIASLFADDSVKVEIW